jgi:hypothetical protein
MQAFILVFVQSARTKANKQIDICKANMTSDHFFFPKNNEKFEHTTFQDLQFMHNKPVLVLSGW